LSFDAHPDLGWHNHPEIVEEISTTNLREIVKGAALRPSTLTLLSTLSTSSEIYSVMSEECVIHHYNVTAFYRQIFSGGSAVGEYRPTKSDAIRDWQQKLRSLRIGGYLSPPLDLQELKKVIKNSVAYDIDADYMKETTQECFEPAWFQDIPIHIDSTMGSVRDLAQLISSTKPPLITISEMKREHLDNENSKSAEFLRILRRLGYEITYGTVWSDNEAEAAIKKIKRLASYLDDKEEDGTIRTVQDKASACREFLSSLR